MISRATNWAGNITYEAERIHRPESVAELQRVVAGAGHVRALGSRHSFNAVADSPGELVSLADLPPMMDIAADRASVTVAAGTTYADLAPRLHAEGLALENLASLPHLTIAGACATG